MIIGSPFTGPNGAVEVLQRSGFSFSTYGLPPLVFGLGQVDARAGASVSIGSSGSIAIGQPGADGNNEIDGGTVRVWDDIASLPVDESTVDSSSDSQQDQFGFTVAVDGNRMAVTAAYDDEPNPRSGSVQIFERLTPFNPWVFSAIVRDPNPTRNGLFGDALALKGNTLAVGKSDRWGDQIDAGEVSVFTVSGATWTLAAGTPLTSGLGTYDAFGASLALVDEGTLIIGAPEAGGSGAVFFSTFAASWSPPNAISYITPPGSGDQLGFSLDTYNTTTGYVLAVGAPGDDNAGPDAGGVWIHEATPTVPALLTVVGNSGLWSAGDRVGTSVAADHGRIAVAGAGNQTPGATFQAHVIEFDGAVWDSIWNTSTGLGNAVNGVPNDYVDIYGGTVALGRPGGGGQVEIFRADGSLNGFALSADDVFVPSGTTAGDRFGHSVDIDGHTLAAGAPGDNLVGDSTGAVFAVSVPIVATFTGAVDSDWDTPGNWDVGVVPDPIDTAIVPIAGFAEVDTIVEASFVISSEGQVNVLAGGRFFPYSDWSGMPSQVEGTIEIQSGGSLTMVADNGIALDGGTIRNLPGGNVGIDAFDEGITIGGTGTWINSGVLTKDGPAYGEVDAGITWTSDVNSDINILEGELTFFMPMFEEGSVAVEADASVRYLDDFASSSGVVLAVAIEGPGPEFFDYGRFSFDSLSAPSFGGATLRTVGGYTPVGGDVYDVASCYDCGSPDLIYDIGSLEPIVDPTPGNQVIRLSNPGVITVDTTDGIGLADGLCSLPEAILAANSDAPVDACTGGSGADTIDFNLAGAGPHTISLTSALPVVTETITIDGYSQPGASANTLAVGSDAVILIELDGSSAGGATGLDFRDAGSVGSVVQGLAVDGFFGYAIAAGPGTQIRGNHIGTDPAGATSLANSYGILIDTAATQPVTVGGTTPADRNVIAGNALIGIQVLAVGGTTADTSIVGNYIGTDASGTAALPNGSEGIWVGADPGALVTGTTIGDGTAAGRNVISGNSGEGIALWDNSTLTVIRGNYVGVGADGTSPLGNALSACGFCFGGVTIRNSISNNTIGGNLPGDGNVIANNPSGVIAFSGWNNRIVGNSIFDNLDSGLLVSPVAIPAGSLNFFPPANDPGDPDFGANFAQNYPVVVPAIDTGNLIVDYSIDSAVTNSAYPIQIDLYAADTVVSGEGKTLLGRTSIAAPGSSSVDLGDATTLGVALGDPIVATATDANGNTSNFSMVASIDVPDVPANKVVPNVVDLTKFGSSVSIDGDWAAVGQPGEVGATGAVSVLQRNPLDGSWSIVQTIVDPTRVDFGISVALDGNTLAIASNVPGGAGEVQVFDRPDTATPFAVSILIGSSEDAVIDLNGDDLIIGIDSVSFGAVDIWSRASGSWQLELNTSGGPGFGYDVAIDGDLAAVSVSGNLIAGQVNVYQRSGATWTLVDTLNNPDAVTSGDTWFGSALDLQGSTLVVGHSLNDDPDLDEGAVWVYEGSPGSFDGTEVKLTGTPTGTGDVFGQSVDIDGDWIVVGAPAHNESGVAARAGAAFVFNRDGGAWSQTDFILAGDRNDEDLFGGSVAVTDTGGDAVLLVGGPNDNNIAGIGVGAVYSFEAALLVPGKILNPTPDLDDFFGTNVDIDGTTMVVGAYLDDGVAANAGAAYVYEKIGGVWTFQQSLDAATLSSGYNFGFDVAVDGDLIVVATATEGAAPIFVVTYRRSGGVWTLSEELSVAGASSTYSVDIDGGRVLISDAFGDNVYVYDDNGSALVNQVALPDPSGVPGGFYGHEVGIAGDVIVVGAPFQTNAAGPSAGAAYIWEYDGLAWQPSLSPQPPDLGPNGRFGHGISVSDDTVAIGYLGATLGPDIPGGVGVVSSSSGAWVYEQTLVGSASATGTIAGLRASVSIDGESIAFGTAREDSTGGTDAGATYVFQRQGGSFVEVERYVAPDGGAGDLFGISTAIRGDDLAIGAVLDPLHEGAVYVFDAPPPPPIDGRIYAPDAAAGDYFGQSVDIHDDWMVVGARYGDGLSVDTGSAYVFRRDSATGVWDFVTALTADGGTTDQWYGYSVAISGTNFDDDGDPGNFVIAVGAPDLFGATDGAVYLYRYDFGIGDWVLARQVDGPTSSNDFGFSVALEQTSVAYRNGTYALAVGAPSFVSTTDPGSAYLYRYTVTENPSFGDALVPVGTGDAPTPVAGAKHGFAVALDGDSMIVGEANAPSGSFTSVGRAHVYRYDVGGGGSVTFEGTLTQPAADEEEDDNFGRTVDIDGDLAVVGSLFDLSGGPGAGAAYVYRRTDSSWGAAEELVTEATGSGNFGAQARVEDGIVAVSALFGGSNDAGTVEVFTFDVADGWVADPALEWQLGATNTGMGAGLALSEDGVLAAGAAEDDNDGGANAGAVQVFDVNVPLPDNKFTTAQDIDLAEFGGDVDVDGEWAIVAAEGAGPNGGGSAFMFRKVAGEWQLFQELADQTPSPDDTDDYGIAVAVGGDYAAVADQDDFVFLHHFDGNVWQPVGVISTLLGNNVVDLDIDGANARIIIGESTPAESSGLVRIANLSPTGASADLVLEPSTSVFYGRSVAIQGDYAFAAAQRVESATGVALTGSVAVLQRSSGEPDIWSPVQFLESPSGATGQLFGSAVDADGDRLIIGQSGGRRAWIFERTGTTWGDPVELVATGAQGGRSVGISGDLAAVGSPRGSVDGLWAGTADVFARAGATWVLADTVSPSDREFGDAYAASLAIDGGDLFVGAPYDTNLDGVIAGAAYVYVVEPPDFPEFGSFDFAAVTSPAVSIASTGFPAENVTTSLVNGDSVGDGSVSSTPLSSIDVDQPVGTEISASPVASLTLGDLPLLGDGLTAAGVESPLDTIPLTDLSVSVPIPNTSPAEIGGWEYIFSQVAISNPTVGTALLQRPLQNITFGEVKSLPEVAALRLDEISVAGTPVASLPVASLVLGSVPVASLPTEDGQTQAETEDAWCDALAGTAIACPTTGLDGDLTLFEITIAGVPVASLPVASLPVASLPVASLPVASLPVASLDLAASPVASLPVASLPVASLPVASLPVASLPVASLPVASLPVASLPTQGTDLDPFANGGGTLASVPVASLYLQGLPVASLPVASLPVASLPVASLPVASLPVASLSVASLPVASLPVASLDLATLDVSGTPVASLTTDGTLASLPVASLPVASLPVASLPVASLPVASLPVASLPVASLPVASLPVASLPVASLDVTGTPVASLTTDNTLATLPVASLPVASLPVASLPVASLPVASLSAVVDCGTFDCTDPDASLADALSAAPVAGATLADLVPLLGGVRWGDLLFAIGLDIDQFAAVVADARNNAGQPFTLADILTEGGGFDTLTLGELPNSVLELLVLGDIAQYLTGLRLSDLFILFDQGGVQLDPVAVEQAITDAKNALTLQFQDLLTFDDLVLADLPDLNGLSLGEIAPYLTGVRFDDLLELFAPLTAAEVEAALITMLENSGLEIQQLDTSEMTIGDLLSGDDLGGLTLGELLLEILAADPNALDGITLGDLLLAFVSPTDYPWEDVAFDDVDTATLPGVVGSIAFETSFDITSTDRSQQVEFSVIAPGTASYLPGTATLDGDPLDTEPVALGDALVWTLGGLAPDTMHVLGFDLQPTLDLGTSVISTEARIVGVGGTVTATSNVSVGQAFEVNDTPPQATQLDEDTLYLTHIPTADDIDYFQIEVVDGDRLIVNLSNLDADFDVLVYGQSEAASIVPLVPPSGQSAGGVLEDPEFELDGTTQVTSEVVNDAPVAAGLSVVATGNRRGVAAETVVTPPLESGTVYVQVYGANGATSPQPAVLQARITQSDDVPPCSALSLPAGGVLGGASSVPADANTLILVNQQRLSALYPTTYQNVTGVGGELEQLIAFLNGPGSGLGIVPGVVNVDSISGIGTQYGQWDANPCEPTLANSVVAAITAEITELRLTRSIDHIMVIGGDDVIPMARVVDGTEISNEFDYRYTFGGNNAIAGAAWASQLLTDEPYGDTAALALGDRFLYITDTALGRLVESPDEIAFQLDQFQVSEGSLNPTTGLVVGYDFLDDGSEAIAADMRAAGLTVDDEYGSSTDADNWSAQDLTDKLFPTTGSTPDIISLNAHFDHRRALPALGNLEGDESDLFQAQTVFDAAPGSLTGRVTFSMGCHSSLSVSDQTIGVLSDDFAQAFTQQGGIYVGNTGYGYGDTETVAYSERLMELFSEQLVNPILLQNLTAPTTAGQALQYAKNDFFAELGVVSVYDEKALMESTFYGIPFYRVGLDAVAAEPTPDNETVTDPVTGEQAVSLTVVPTNALVPTDDGDKYVNFDDSGDPLEQKAPYNPSQPLEVVDVTVVDPGRSELLGTVARGVLLVGMASNYFANDPVIVKPITDGSAIQLEPDVGEVLFPAKPAAIRTTEQPEGTRQSIALSTGQFRGSSTSGTQRLDERIDLVVYYSPESEDDFTPPTIRTASSVVVDDQLTVTVEASDTGGSSGLGTDVDRIYVLAAPNPGTGPVEWIGLNLVRDTPASDRWVGSIGLPSGTNNVEFIVQAKDNAGNVGYATNKAGNFTDDTVPPAPPPPELVLDIGPGAVGVEETNGWFDGPVLVEAEIPGISLDFQLDDGPRTQLTPAGVLVEGQGSHVIEIFTSPDPDEEPIKIVIRIDTAPPTAVVASPADGAIVPAGAALFANFVCQDPSLRTCTATLDDEPILFGADLSMLREGEHTLEVTAVDAVNDPVTDTSIFTVDSPGAPTTIETIVSPTTPQLISDGVEIKIEFDDPNNGADDYRLTVDWGNLDENETPGSSATCLATSDSAMTGNPSCSIDSNPTALTNGTASAAFVYPEPGVYLVTVTVEDGAENSDSIESNFVVVYDPEAGRVSGSGWYWSGNAAYDDGDPYGNFAKFGYNARYRAGESVPSGKTKLRLVGEFFFKSTSYDYLIINDTVAVAEGVGKVGNNSGYRFRVQGIDNGWLDLFQITIWNDETGEILYDNGVLYDEGDLVLHDAGDLVLLGGIRIRS